MKFVIKHLTLLALVFSFLALGSIAEACNHVPAQTLLQGGVCPTCGATAASVTAVAPAAAVTAAPAQAVVTQPAPVQYVQTQPVQVVQRVVVPNYSQSLNVVQAPLNVVQTPAYTTSALSVVQPSVGVYSGGLNVVASPLVVTPRQPFLSIQGPFGGGIHVGGGRFFHGGLR
jgi:hypothetical protein